MLAFHGIFRMQFVFWVVSFTLLKTSFFFPLKEIYFYIISQSKSEPRSTMIKNLCVRRGCPVEGEGLGVQGLIGEAEC